MQTLNSAELSAVGGGNRIQAAKEVGKWVVQSAAWEGVTAFFGSIRSTSGSGGQMNSSRRSNMYNRNQKDT
jgi:hypothetical protein